MDSHARFVIIEAPPVSRSRRHLQRRGPMNASNEIPAEAKLQRKRERTFGLICGLTAAVAYTLANMALRQSSRPGDFDWSIWVTAHKALPSTLLTWTLVTSNFLRGKQALPGPRVIGALILAGVIMQCAGNLSFQYALSLIGLAMSVPIAFALILFSGAVFSRIFLGEPITTRSVLALLVLMVAVSLLSFGAGEASRSILADASGAEILRGVLVAMLAGTAYGVCGVFIRRHVRNLPVSATLVWISTTGLVCMGTAALTRIPWDVLASTPPRDTITMLLAGTFNAGAFYCIGQAFRYLSVNQVNMVNTTQIAMATMAGVVFFAEPLTLWLSIGVILTITGLYLMDPH